MSLIFEIHISQTFSSSLSNVILASHSFLFSALLNVNKVKPTSRPSLDVSPGKRRFAIHAPMMSDSFNDLVDML